MFWIEWEGVHIDFLLSSHCEQLSWPFGGTDVCPRGIGVVVPIAIAIGIIAGNKLPEKPIKVGASLIFFVFGIWLILEALL